MDGRCSGKGIGGVIKDAKHIDHNFSFRNYQWFWVPIVCPLIGAALGAWVYQIVLGIHIPDAGEEVSGSEINLLQIAKRVPNYSQVQSQKITSTKMNGQLIDSSATTSPVSDSRFQEIEL